MLSREWIKSAARSVGFDLCGVARVRVLERERGELRDWIAGGRHGGLGYMERGVERRTDPGRLVEGARTVIVCAASYNHGAHTAVAESGAPRVASYALARDYHDVLGRMLDEMLSLLPSDVAARRFVDTAPIMEKAWAVEAGLGWRGRNSLLVTPRYGSMVVLGEIVTEAQADGYDEPWRGTGCGECRRCEESCPAGAICAPGVVDASRCISRLTIEKPPPGHVEEPGEDSRLHGWIFGCDECQSVCPHNRVVSRGNPALAPLHDPAAFWRSLSEEDFAALMAPTPLSRAGQKRLLKVVCNSLIGRLSG